MTPSRAPIRIPLKPDSGRGLAREERDLARLAKALGHPARVAILRLLFTRGDCICGDIVERLPLAQATVSQHLKVLKEAGWIQGSIDGPRVCYCAEPDTVRKFSALFGALIEERSTT
ncbi:MAG TPA: metalloregulator ArsR/SmtB family transcription factor [Candidatus Eisenbacteria bacterium]|nr:metalloregulator ArsR/SmtB family transcription factor [Candidatus Eisenbacteria bacterium]